MTTWFRWPCELCSKDFRAAGIALVRGSCAAVGAAITGRPMPVGEMGGE